MRGRSRIIIGAVVLAFGLILLIQNVTGIGIWNYTWPLILIGIGVWVLTRASRAERHGPTVFQLLGDVRRRGSWVVREEEIWCIIGDVRLDLTEAQIPEGETTLRVQGFVGNVTLSMPDNVGLRVTSSSFVTSARVFGPKQDYVLTPYESESDNYQDAVSKIHLDLGYFVVDLRAREQANYQTT